VDKRTPRFVDMVRRAQDALGRLTRRARPPALPGVGGPSPVGDRIEQLKDLEWVISENEIRYKDLLDSHSDLLMRAEPSGRVTFVNKAFCRTFGVEARDVLGTCFSLAILERDEVGGAEAAASRRRTYEALIDTTEGPRWFVVEVLSITHEDGRGEEVQTIARDISEQRRARLEFARARDEAEAANRAKSRFLAAMSHEIRTPMNGILGMTGLLAETSLTAEQRSYVDAVDLSAKNLLTIIDEILDLSKIEAGKLEIHPAPFMLDDCVQGVVELMAPRAREKTVDLAWRIDPGLPRVVVGDETRVRQILLNLVGNAIKFTDAGGVSVRVTRRSTIDPMHVGAEISVADTGSGMTEAQIATLFTEFEQPDEVVRRKRSGSGLGLAISRRLARAMQGDITVESTVGSGSTFRANLTFGRALDGLAAGVSSTSGAARRVIIVSDRLQQRQVLSEILQAAGLIVECRSVGDALCRRGAAGRDDAHGLVIDVEIGAAAIGTIIGTLDGGDGRPPRTVLVVDHPSQGRQDEFRTTGCDAYVVRPVRPSALLVQLNVEVGPERRDPARLELHAGRVSGDVVVDAEPRRILLVEDNAINAILAQRMCERSGCAVHHARNGRFAVEYCAGLLEGGRPAPDLVLMDIHMPEMDGFEAAQRIKALYAAAGLPSPPVVALTANAFAEDRKRCLDEGLDDYLAKPFERSDLEALLEKWATTRISHRNGRLGGHAA